MNISPVTVVALRQAGYAVIRVNQVLLATASDQSILEWARQEAMVVITQDLDFSALLALGGYDQPSIVTLRLAVSDPETVTRRLLLILPRLDAELQRGSAVTVDDVTVRVRPLPIR